MAEIGRPVTVRARQRSRNSLRAFADPLVPSFDETGVDRLQVRVKGVCRSMQRGAARDYLSILATNHPDMDWVATPRINGNQTKIVTRGNIPATIGFELVARDRGGHHVGLTIAYACNPTRTLAHLLYRFGNASSVDQIISEISAAEFFSETPGMPLSLDHQTNWLNDPDLARRVFGTDVFTAFLPTYIMQLRVLSAQLVSPDFSSNAVEDGAEDVIRSDDYEVRLDWGSAAAPQAEAYFERHHGSAQAVVRSAAQNVLTKLDNVTVRHHIFETGFERRGDLFSMRSRLPQNRELSIYAKDHHRLRFEVSRKKAGRYPDAMQPGPSGRLLAILTSEREKLLTALQWRVVGELLSEHAVPILGDLVSLLTLTASACAENGNSFSATVSALVIDGGISETVSNTAMLAALVKSGVVERTTLRRRDHGMPRRFSLRGAYLAAFEAVLDAMSTSIDD